MNNIWDHFEPDYVNGRQQFANRQLEDGMFHSSILRRFKGSSGSSSAPAPQQVNKLTPEQEELVKALTEQAMPAVKGVTGATIPGDEFAPQGPTGLQQQAINSGYGLADQMKFDPNRINAAMKPVGDYAQSMFQDESIPAIMGALGGEGSARSSGAANILGKEAGKLSQGLAAQFAPMQYSGYENAQNRQMQIPGMEAQMGGMEASFGNAQREFDLSRFMADAPEADPRLGFIGPAFTSAYDTAMSQGQYGGGGGNSWMMPAATMGSAKIMMMCIPKGTKIDCKEGQKPVENIRAGDIVYDKDNKLVSVRWKYEFDEKPTTDRFIEMTFDNGAKFTACDLHKIDGVYAKDLKIGDKGLVSKKFVLMNTRSYDLMTSGRDGSYRSGGIGIDSMIPELHDRIRKAS